MLRLYTMAVALCIMIFPAVQTYADDCGNNDRVSPPNCFSTGQGWDGQDWKFINRCQGPITIKLDKPGSDKRWDIPASTVGMWDGGDLGTNWRVHCCPRYNRCNLEPSLNSLREIRLH